MFAWQHATFSMRSIQNENIVAVRPIQNRVFQESVYRLEEVLFWSLMPYAIFRYFKPL